MNLANFLSDLDTLTKVKPEELQASANDLLSHYQAEVAPEGYLAIQRCLKSCGIPFAGDKDVTLSDGQYHPQMPPQLFGANFKQATYAFAYEICSLAYLFEQNGIVTEHATKLAVMFDNPSAMLRYLVDFSKSVQFSRTPVHDACLFSLPDFNQPGFSDQHNGCKFELFKSLGAKSGNMLRKDFKEMLPFAWDLQKFVASKREEAKACNHKVDPTKIKAKELIIRQISAQLDHLESKKDDDDFNDEEYKNLIQSLSKNLSELSEFIAGKYLKDLSLIELKAFYEAYKLGTQGAYKIFIDNGIPAKYFAEFKALNRQDAGKNIPNVMVDGKSIGYPGYYLMKVPVADELQAARAACLGKMTNCCQSLSGEAGQPCVIHGLTSPNGGFYVLCEGDSQQPNVDDKVLAMSWAWRSRKEAIVFDSIEVSDAVINQYEEEKVRDFFEYLGRELVNNNHTNKVVCGGRSGISDQIGLSIAGIISEEFKDYNDYNDSSEQRLVYSADEPYYFYDVDENARLRTIAMVDLGNELHLKNKNQFLLSIAHKLPLKTIKYLVKHEDFNLTEDQLERMFKEVLKSYNDQSLAELIEIEPTFFARKNHFETLCLNIIGTGLIFCNYRKSVDIFLKLIANGDIHPEFSDEQKIIFFETAIKCRNLDFIEWLWEQYPDLDKLLSNKTKVAAIEEVGKYNPNHEIADFLMEKYGCQIPKYRVLQAFGPTWGAKYLNSTSSKVKKWPTVVVEPQENTVKPKRPLPQTPQRQQQKAQPAIPSEPQVVSKRPLPKPPVKK